MPDKYIKDSTVFTLRQIRQSNPNMSIPAGADLTALGYTKIEPAGAKPDITDDQIIRQSTEPEEYEPGKWRWTWVVEDKPVPQSVTRLQARLALIDAGLWDAVTAYFQSADRTPAELAFFEDAQNWNRNDPVVIAASSALGLNDEQIDALFLAAAQM